MGLFSRTILAIVSYALQSCLYSKYARKYGGLLVAKIRNISMIVTGLPLLYVSLPIDIDLIYSVLPWIVAAAFVGALNVYLSYEGTRYLPIGISQIIKNASKTITILILSLFFLGESLSSLERIGVCFVVIGSLSLGNQKIDIRHLNTQNIYRGLFLITIGGITNALAWYYFKFYADVLDAFTSAYILEATIGIVFLLYILGERIYLPKQQVCHITSPDLFHMIAIGILPFIGTISTAFAFNLGNYGLVSLLMIGIIPFTFVFGNILFHEKINTKQIYTIVLVIIGLLIIKIGI